MKLRKFRALENENGLDDIGASGLTFPVAQLIKGKIYIETDKTYYDERSKRAPASFVDDNGCSRDIAYMLKNKLVEEIFD